MLPYRVRLNKFFQVCLAKLNFNKNFLLICPLGHSQPNNDTFLSFFSFARSDLVACGMPHGVWGTTPNLIVIEIRMKKKQETQTSSINQTLHSGIFIILVGRRE